jgi:hypothetical protein
MGGGKDRISVGREAPNRRRFMPQGSSGYKYLTGARKSGALDLIARAKLADFIKHCAAEFDNAIKAAARGDVEPLCRILWSDIPLSWDDRTTLATLLRRQLAAKKRGRPRGAADLSKQAQTKRYLIYLVRRSEDLWRRSHPRKQLPRGMRDELIREYAERLTDDDEDLTGISADAIRAELRRGRKR